MAKSSKALKLARKNASTISRSLRSFSKSAAVFSAGSPRLIDKYEDKWVGVYEGKVVASADTLDEVTREISRKGIPLNETMIRRIDRKEKTLIL
jgi:hypothetical protein